MEAYDYQTPDIEVWIDSSNAGGDGTEGDPYTHLKEAITAVLGTESANDVITFWFKNGMDNFNNERWNTTNTWASGVILQFRAYAGQEAEAQDKGAGLETSNTSSWLAYRTHRFYDLRIKPSSGNTLFFAAAQNNSGLINCLMTQLIKQDTTDTYDFWLVNSVFTSTSSLFFDNDGGTTGRFDTHVINCRCAGRLITRAYGGIIAKNSIFEYDGSFLATYTGDYVSVDNCALLQSAYTNVDANANSTLSVNFTGYYEDTGALNYRPTSNATSLLDDGDPNLTDVPTTDARGVTRADPCERGAFEYSSGITPLSADYGSFTLTGQAADLKIAALESVAVGSFTLTGQAVESVSVLSLGVDQGSITLTGQAADLRHGVAESAAAGSFALTGQAAGLLVAAAESAGFGSFALTGQAADLRHGVAESVAAGSFTLAGQAAGLVLDGALPLDQGAFTLTGQAAGLWKGTALSVDAGVFALTGQAADLLVAAAESADYGSFTLSGQAAGLVISGLLPVDPGSFALTGNAADLRHGVALSADPGTFALSGQAADLLSALLLDAAAGSYALTGADAGLLAGVALAAGSGSFTLNGISVSLVLDSKVIASNGTFALTGFQILFPSSAPSALGPLHIVYIGGVNIALIDDRIHEAYLPENYH